MFREFIPIFVAITLIFPAPVFASTSRLGANAAGAAGETIDPAYRDLMKNDRQLMYWSTLEDRSPALASFALDGEPDQKLLWNIEASHSLVDQQDPFFMRSQSWRDGNKSDCPEGVCFEKTAEGLQIQFGPIPQVLVLKQDMTPILDTDQYLFMSADNEDLFRAKVNEENPGQGFFYIAKKDVGRAMAMNTPVPIFFVFTVGSGWTGPQPKAYEVSLASAIDSEFRFPDQDGDELVIDMTDVMSLEKVSRNNLQIAQSWSAIEGDVRADGFAYPKVGVTMLFGLQLTGQLPRFPQSHAAQIQEKATEIARAIGRSLLPQAEADDVKPTLRQRLKNLLSRVAKSFEPEPPPLAEQLELFENLPTQLKPEKKMPVPETVEEEQEPIKRPLWRRWLAPGILYGATAALSAAAYQDIDFNALIVDDMPKRIMHISMILGGTALISYLLKISVYKDRLAKLYPESKGMANAKGFLTLFSQSLGVSFYGIGMMVRQILEFAKDRRFPNNKMVHKSWEGTMGFALKTNSRITTDYKATLLGWLFGFADVTLVGVYGLVLAPWAMMQLGYGELGSTTASFASAMLLQQALIYIQLGPQAYARDTKTIQYQSAEAEARAKMIEQRIDPDNPRNENILTKLTEQVLEVRLRATGLAGKEAFFFDALSIWQNSLKWLGFSTAGLRGLTAEEREALDDQDFILSQRHHGLIRPSLISALGEARRIQQESPSDAGAQTVALLEWALADRGLSKPLAGRAVKAGFTPSGWRGMKDAVDASVADWLSNENEKVSSIGRYWAISRGVFKYLAEDSTQKERDIRSVLYTMSATNSDVAEAALEHLPKSWIEKAGSKLAARMAAQLFNRHYMGYAEKDIQSVNAVEDDADIVRRAEVQLAKIPSTDLFHNNDPFERRLNRNTIITRLKAEDRIQREIDNWQPKKDSWYARLQWKKAFERASAAMPPRDDRISEEWIGLAKTYAAGLSGAEAQAFEVQAWVRDQQFKFLFAQEFARTVGLHINGVEDSSFVRKVMVSAIPAAEKQLTGGKAAYAAKLAQIDETQRQVFTAKLFTETLIDKYVQMSVNTDKYLRASDAQFPGRLQRVRKWLVGKPGSNYVLPAIHGLEMFGRNETDAYRPGIWAMLDRSVPFVPDLAFNVVRTLRNTPYAATAGFATNRWFYGLPYPYVMYVASQLLGATNGAFVEINNRMQRNLDLKPMGGVPEKLLFAWFHSFFTNPQVSFEVAVADPLVEAVDHGVGKLISECQDLLMGAKAPLVRVRGGN